MFKKVMAGVAAAALMTVGLTACASGSEESSASEEVTFFQVQGWEDTVGVTMLWQELLAEQDIKMNVEDLDLAAGFAAVAKGDIDGHINTWLPVGHASFVEKYKDDLVKLDENGGYYDNDKFLIAVPDYAPADSIQDLVDNADQFGNEIIGIEPGSGLMTATPGMVAEYGGTDSLKVIEGSTAAMMASLEAAIAKKENVAVTLWSPHWAFAKMPIKALEDPKGAYGKPDSSIVVVNKAFKKNHAKIAEWMTNMELSDEQYASLMWEVNNGDTPQKGAQNWLKDPANRELADSWIS